MQHYELGQYIKNKRISLGYTLNKFAIHSEIDSATLSNFERGLSGINLDTIELIAKGFNQTLGEFFTEYELQNKK
ncbi:MAG: helix-turn-helix transcriptional regulator [Candidatus Gastranaerophilales bacterium]|nr:helix-turn-helix transcriptional regulator [Candidatus Gastranaerophilales bacterium]